MFRKLLGTDRVCATMVLALSGYAMVVAAKGEGSLSLERVVARVLSDPVARGAAGTHRSSTVVAPRREVEQIAG